VFRSSSLNKEYYRTVRQGSSAPLYMGGVDMPNQVSWSAAKPVLLGLTLSHGETLRSSGLEGLWQYLLREGDRAVRCVS
jgi:hypothetical protein